MNLIFKKKEDKFSIIFKEDGISSDILYLNRDNVKSIIESATLALRNENDKKSVFKKDIYSFIKQDNNTFLLSININEYYSIGKYLSYQNMKRIISQLKGLLK